MLAPPDIDALQVLFVARWQHAPRPEQVERLVFLISIVLAVPSALVAWRAAQAAKLAARAAGLLVILLVTVFGALVLPSDFLVRIVYGQPGTDIGIDRTFIGLLFGAVPVAVVTIWRLHAVPWLATPGPRPWLDMALFLLALLSVSTVRLRTAGTLAGDLHFEAVYYTITQVAAGRTVLANLPAQYGLYAEFLAPVLTITRIAGCCVVERFRGAAVDCDAHTPSGMWPTGPDPSGPSPRGSVA